MNKERILNSSSEKKKKKKNTKNKKKKKKKKNYANIREIIHPSRMKRLVGKQMHR